MATIAEAFLAKNKKRNFLTEAAQQAQNELEFERARKRAIKLARKNTYPKYRTKKDLGVVMFKAKNLEQEIKKLPDGRYYVHTSRPTGEKGKVVNVTIFGHKTTLQTLKGKEIVCRASIMQKIILDKETGKKTTYHNLDLKLVHPSTETKFEVKVGQGRKPKGVHGINNPNHQGGYIFVNEIKK